MKPQIPESLFKLPSSTKNFNNSKPKQPLKSYTAADEALEKRSMIIVKDSNDLDAATTINFNTADLVKS